MAPLRVFKGQFCWCSTIAVLLLLSTASAFVPLSVHTTNNNHQHVAVSRGFLSGPTTSLHASSDGESPKEERQTLGLLTFDLDDTLYPIAVVEKEANQAFVKAMENYGFNGVQPNDIVQTAQRIRAELSKEDSAKAAALTHSELRRMAIRSEMERITVQRKLEACAEDWSTSIDALSPLVTKNALR